MAHDKDTRDSVCVFLTVHDVGVNHNGWRRFVNSPAMAEIREKAVFLHVDLSGQEDGAEEISSFPSMQEIGEDLVNILDTLRVKVSQLGFLNIFGCDLTLIKVLCKKSIEF